MLHAHMNVSVIHALQRTHYSVREMQIMSEFNTQPGGTQPGNTQPSNAPYGTQQQTPYGQQAGSRKTSLTPHTRRRRLGSSPPMGQRHSSQRWARHSLTAFAPLVYTAVLTVG